MTSYIKAKIYYMQPNSKCILRGNKDKTINCMISECSKLAQRSIRLDTLGWKRWSTGNSTRKWNLTMLLNGICTNQKSSKTMKRIKLWKIFLIQTDHFILAKRPDIVQIYQKKKKKEKRKKKRTCRLVNFAVPMVHEAKTKKKRKERLVLRLCQKTKKVVEHERGSGASCS